MKKQSKHLKKMGNQFVIGESIWGVIKSIITGKVDVDKLPNNSPLKRINATIEKEMKKKMPNSDQTYGEYWEEEGKKLRDKYNY